MMRTILSFSSLVLLTTTLACAGDDLSTEAWSGSDDPLAQVSSEPLLTGAGADLVLLHDGAGPGREVAARHLTRSSWRCADGVTRSSCPVASVRWPEGAPDELNELARAPRGSERLAVRARWRPDGALLVDEVLERAGREPLASRVLRVRGDGTAPSMDVTPLTGGQSWRESWLDVSAVPGDDAWRNRVQVAARSPSGVVAFGRRQGSASARHLAVDDAFVARSFAPPLCGAALLQALGAAADGLLWPSESDRPIEAVVRGAVPAEATTLDEAVRAWLSLPASDTIEDRAMRPFTWLGREDATQSDDERAQAARFRALRALLEQQLTDVTTLAVGATEVRVLVVGRSRCGELSGVQSWAIET